MSGTKAVEIDQRKRTVFRMSDQRDIIQCRECIWKELQGLQSAGAFDALVGIAVVDAKQELALAAVSLVDIKGIIAAIRYHDIGTVHSSSEKLHTIVLIGNDFHVVDDSLSAHTPECEPVDFISLPDVGAAMPDGYIPEDP